MLCSHIRHDPPPRRADPTTTAMHIHVALFKGLGPGPHRTTVTDYELQMRQTKLRPQKRSGQGAQGTPTHIS